MINDFCKQDQLLRAATGWLERGVSVVPVDIQKRPTVISLTKFKTARPAESELTDLFRNPHVAGYGLITGDVSGGLGVLDFDSPSDYALFATKHPDLADTFTVETARGYHVYFYCDEQPKAQTLDEPFHVEIKSGGLYVVGPYSQHASGVRYTVCQRKPIKRVASLNTFLESLTANAARTRPVQHRTDLPLRSAEGNPNPSLSGKVASALNWRGRGEWLNGRCSNPDHADRHPSAGFNAASGVYHCFVCGTATLKQVAAWLGIDSLAGWQYRKAEEISAPAPENGCALHVNLATHYPDKRAYPLLAAVDMWLTAGGETETTLNEFCQFVGYTPERIHYLVRKYGASLHVEIDDSIVTLPTLYHLARTCGLRGVGPTYELPDHVDASTRGGASRARTWLFLADRAGKPTPARWMAKQLGHASHQTAINHAQDTGIQILRGQRREVTEAEADSISYKPVFWLTAIDGVRKWHETREAARDWLAGKVGEISAVVAEANRYSVGLSAHVHRLDISQEILSYASSAKQALVRLTAPTTLKPAIIPSKGRYKRSPWRAYPVQFVELE